MKRKSLILAMIALILLLSACGKDSEPVNNEPSETDDENEMTKDQESTVEPSTEKALEVIIRSDKTADFIFNSDTAEGIDNLTAVTVQFTKDYLIGLNDFDAVGKYQCSMWRVEGNDRSLMEDIGASYTIDGSKVILTADMTGVDDFSFLDLNGDCILHYEYKDQGGPQFTLSWADVAKQKLDKTAETDTETGSETPVLSHKANANHVTEILGRACGEYLEYAEKGTDSLELVRTDNGFMFKNMKLVSRDAMYNDGTDSSTDFGMDMNAEEIDEENVRVTFQTQMMADEGMAVINKQGFIEIKLKGPNMPDYSKEFYLK